MAVADSTEGFYHYQNLISQLLDHLINSFIFDLAFCSLLHYHAVPSPKLQPQ